MVESRLLRDVRTQRIAEDEFTNFVEFLLIALDEPDVRAALSKAIGPRSPAPAPAAAPPPSVRGTRTRGRGGRRG